MNSKPELLKELLSKYVVFSSSAWLAAESLFTCRQFSTGENIIEAGEQVKEIGFILNGLARYYYLTINGVEFNKSFSQQGQVVSSTSSLVTGEPSPFFIQALEPCECIFLKYNDLIVLCDNHRDWERLVRQLLTQLAIKKERREADFLLLSAQERYQTFLVEYADIVERIPNYHIASYLGITEVALSRIRKRLGMTGN